MGELEKPTNGFLSNVDRSAARALCAASYSDFCRNVGGEMGCRNGRGDHGAHCCIANDYQLELSGLVRSARETVAVALRARQHDGAGA